MAVLSDDDFVRLFQTTFGLVSDGDPGNETVAKLRQLAVAAGVAIPEAEASEIPDDYWPMLAKIESGTRLYIQAPTSSASGLYQFIKSTWEGEGRSMGADDPPCLRRPQAFRG